MRAMRRSLTDRAARSARIWSHVRPLLPVASVGSRPLRVLLFDTIPGEPDTKPWIDWCRAAGFDTAVPGGEPDPAWPDVVIVPGLAFSPAGDRLGQGGGWYDRFLARRRDDCVTIGVGFDEQIVAALPSEAHDVRLDHVVTESGRANSGASPMAPFTVDELARATAVVRRHVPPTPQYEWPLLSAAAGSTVVVKHENHTPVGAFKVRGGLVYVDRLVRERPAVRGIVSATRGNHGQSLAFAGRAHGVPVCIVVPRGNSVEKNAAMRALGAEVIEIGDDFQEARAGVDRARGRARVRARPAVPSRPRARCRDLRRGVVRGGTVARHGVRAGRDGVRDQRAGRGARPARTIDVDRRRRVRCRAGHALVVRRRLRGHDRVRTDVRRRRRVPRSRRDRDRGDGARRFADPVGAGWGDRRGDADHLPHDAQRGRVGRRDRTGRFAVRIRRDARRRAARSCSPAATSTPTSSPTSSPAPPPPFDPVRSGPVPKRTPCSFRPRPQTNTLFVPAPSPNERIGHAARSARPRSTSRSRAMTTSYNLRNAVSSARATRPRRAERRTV